MRPARSRVWRALPSPGFHTMLLSTLKWQGAPVQDGPRGGAGRARERTAIMAMLTGSDLLARSLRALGVEAFFYVMGGPMLETESACIRLGLRAIDTRHEQAAAFMAHAYTRVTRRPGVCMGCSGPGMTNLVTGIANAFADACPLVALGGSSPRIYLGIDR